jgi:hypothetical protein
MLDAVAATIGQPAALAVFDADLTPPTVAEITYLEAAE